MVYFIFSIIASIFITVICCLPIGVNKNTKSDVILSSAFCGFLMLTGGISLMEWANNKQPQIIDYVRGDVVEQYTIKTDKNGDTISIDTTFVWKNKN